MATLKYSPSLSPEDTAVVSQYSKDVISEAAQKSKNDTVCITSTLRLPERQALAMYNNLANGSTIRYAAPGREVCSLYYSLKKQGKGREAIIAAMTDKIVELAAKSERVSRHCVSKEQYARLNVVDVAHAMANPRDFAKELARIDSVEKVITPYFAAYDSPKITHDPKEPAIHIEIRQ